MLRTPRPLELAQVKRQSSNFKGWTVRLGCLPGNLRLVGDDTQIVFALGPLSQNDPVAPTNTQGLENGKYKATLFGDTDLGRSLLDVNNRALDGEANGFHLAMVILAAVLFSNSTLKLPC